MLTALTLTLFWLATAGLVIVGSLALVAPAMLALNYGIPADDRATLTYVRACGIRDIAFGAIFTVFGTRGEIVTMAWSCAIVAVLALVDFFLSIAYSRGQFRLTHLSHLIGAVGFAVIAVLLVILR